MKMWFALVPVALTAALLSNEAAAGPTGTAEAGAAKSAVCAACHGANGNSVNPEWPNLAAQGRQYIAEQLAAFKSGVRVNALMSPMAMPLTEQDMADLAAYFHAQTPTGGEADPALALRGQQLYRAGDPAKGEPAELLVVLGAASAATVRKVAATRRRSIRPCVASMPPTPMRS